MVNFENMKKLFSLVLAALTLVLVASPVLATQEEPKVDQCGEEFTSTKTGDFSNDRVDINFTQGNVVVTAKEGYVLVSIAYDWQGDGEGDLDDFWGVDQNPATVDAQGSITDISVIVKRVCGEVCNDETASNFEEVVEGQTVANNELCVFPEPEVKVATPSVLPQTGDFNGWQALAIVELILLVGFGIKYRFRKD